MSITKDELDGVFDAAVKPILDGLRKIAEKSSDPTDTSELCQYLKSLAESQASIAESEKTKAAALKAIFETLVNIERKLPHGT